MHTAVFVIYTLLVTYLSLRQIDVGIGIEPWDKLVHLLMYYIFAVFGYRALKEGRGYWLLCLGIIAYGVLLEFAQAYTPGRFTSVYDMLANTLGVFLGALVVTRKR